MIALTKSKCLPKIKTVRQLRKIREMKRKGNERERGGGREWVSERYQIWSPSNWYGPQAIPLKIFYANIYIQTKYVNYMVIQSKRPENQY